MSEKKIKKWIPFDKWQKEKGELFDDETQSGCSEDMESEPDVDMFEEEIIAKLDQILAMLNNKK